MKVAIGADHAGYEYKNIILQWLQEQNNEVTDFGPDSADSMDYPDTAHPLASAVESGEYEYGILICGSGNGVCMTANHHKGIRAGLAWNVEVAELIRQHNNANIICLPARFIDIDLAKACVTTFLNTAFEGGRHARRADKISC
ncbi:ribose 5-phosphate isomerase B [Emticicia sp. 21SJ11W-3]|uniref:ribose 5-phosphate isomerase B n=1 Tax=Emticicia sp. 21SJ11W-3 TaxID=2916755 RepID=UPI00209F7FDD|nr:ribose 5-phosphate isomerase B [Emticicia sp. 21SJ11W-3]UTA69989.1 ribose 5-phosphate isomerase B [Emticicia sp. 21SJ11W-3]